MVKIRNAVFKCDVNNESSIKCGLVNGMAITPGIFRRAVSADVNGSTAEMGSDSWAIITAFFFCIKPEGQAALLRFSANIWLMDFVLFFF